MKVYHVTLRDGRVRDVEDMQEQPPGPLAVFKPCCKGMGFICLLAEDELDAAVKALRQLGQAAPRSKEGGGGMNWAEVDTPVGALRTLETSK